MFKLDFQELIKYEFAQNAWWIGWVSNDWLQNKIAKWLRAKTASKYANYLIFEELIKRGQIKCVQ
jgi:hypothetical protein